MGFGPLRVLNEDRLAPGGAYPPQRRANMDILCIVLDGALAHRDSSGGEGVLHPGDVLWLGAGHGIEHELRNPDPGASARLFQAWLQPDRLNAAPASAQRRFELGSRRARWELLASPDGGDGALALRLQAWLRASRLRAGEGIAHPLQGDRRCWLQVTAGEIEVAGHRLGAGDALGIEGEAGTLALAGIGERSEVLLFDLPG